MLHHPTRPPRRALLALPLLCLLLAGCLPGARAPEGAPQAQAPAPTAPRAATRTPRPTPRPRLPTPALPTATAAAAASSSPGHYVNAEVGVALDYPERWETQPGEQEGTLTWLYPQSRSI